MIKMILAICMGMSSLIGQEVSRMEDLKAILHETFWTPRSELFLNIQVAETMLETKKQMDGDLLLQNVKIDFENQLPQLAASWSVFSDADLHALRAIIENPVYQKYNQLNNSILQNNVQVLKNLFKEQIQKNGTSLSSSSRIAEWTDATFQQELDRAHQMVIVEVYSNSCRMCQLMSTVFDPLSEEYTNVQFAKVNYQTQTAIAKQFEITSLPTFLIFRPGQKTPVMKFVGFTSKKDLAAKISLLKGL